MGKWKKLPAIPGRNNPCLNCPPILNKLSMRHRIAVGFGDAHVERDGLIVYREPIGLEITWEDCRTVMMFENRARKNPNHDWRIVLNSPLHGETYQRQGRNSWVLVKTNHGFA